MKLRSATGLLGLERTLHGLELLERFSLDLGKVEPKPLEGGNDRLGDHQPSDMLVVGGNHIPRSMRGRGRKSVV